MTKRASEVPPDVDRTGCRFVSCWTTPRTMSTKGPGAVRNASPEIWASTLSVTPVCSCTAAARSRRRSSRPAPVCRSLKRMLTTATAFSGITFDAGLPQSIVVICSPEGSK